MISPSLIIAKKEIMDNIRNKWIIIITIIFVLLTILASYGGSYGQGWKSLELTIVVMILLVQIIISIIGLILGYASISGEIEQGSLSSLVAQPVTRLEILLGKFLGLGAVLSFTILVGFGIAGLIIGINVPNVNFGGYFLFIVASILIGLVFLSLSLFYSSFFKKRSTSMGMAIFTWIIYMPILWTIIMGIILFATTSYSDIIRSSIPDWYYAINLINPQTIYSSIVSINIIEVADVSYSYPSFYNNTILLGLMAIWIIIPLVIAYFMFNRRDV